MNPRNTLTSAAAAFMLSNCAGTPDSLRDSPSLKTEAAQVKDFREGQGIIYNVQGKIERLLAKCGMVFDKGYPKSTITGHGESVVTASLPDEGVCSMSQTQIGDDQDGRRYQENRWERRPTPHGEFTPDELGTERFSIATDTRGNNRNSQQTPNTRTFQYVSGSTTTGRKETIITLEEGDAKTGSPDKCDLVTISTDEKGNSQSQHHPVECSAVWNFDATTRPQSVRLGLEAWRKGFEQHKK